MGGRSQPYNKNSKLVFKFKVNGDENLPPVVDNGLELDFVFLNLIEPLPHVSVPTLCEVMHVLVRQHDVEDGDNEEEGADKGFGFEHVHGEESHHADLVADDQEEGGVGRCLDQVAF